MSQSVLARELIELLERRGLLDQEIVDALKQQLEESGARVTPEAVAKLLVDNGHLTRFQATKLIGEIRSDQYESDEESLEEEEEAVEAVEAVEDEPELTLTDDDAIDSVEAVEAEAVEAVEAVEAEAVEAMPVDAMPVEAEPVAVEAMPVDAMPVEAMAVDAVPMEATAVPVEAVAVAAEPVGGPKLSKRRSAPVEDEEPESSIWDSWKIYGVASVILALLVLGTFFYNYIVRGSAADYIQQANTFYQQENYTRAHQVYSDFIDSYGTDLDDSSLARVRMVMCTLYQAKQSSSDPVKFLEAAKANLPTITNEEALDDERANLSGLLIDVAEDFTKRAERTEAADDKEVVIKNLDEHMKLIAEPVYVSTDTRKAMSKRLERIDEDRSRVIRDISRDRKLEATIGRMEEALAKKDTKTAYEERKAIVREYPRLFDEARMAKLILDSGKIQQELVVNNGDEFDVSKDEIKDNFKRAIVLANREGNKINSLSGAVYYVRAGGSVLALAASDGTLLWRKFVGYRDEHPPRPLGANPDAGVLLSDGGRLEIQKLSGKDGKVVWRSAIGETFTSPASSLDTINFATHSGTLGALDAETGETVWAVKMPQPLEVSPGVFRVKDGSNAYIPGNHSNLYVVDHQNGECLQSYYIGHLEESIKTSPVYLMGHLFVFENGPGETCTMHILKTDANGRNLEKAQNSVRLEGKVLVAPEVIKRRLVVVTTLGQVSVFEVEPTAEEDKVSEVAKQVASYEEPALTQMAIDPTQMWVTGNEIVRYEIQINTGRIVRSWVKYTNDLFTAKPQVMGGALVHARVVSGTKGIRVTAVEPKTGDKLWQTDIGVPTAAVTPQLHAITSQGALYLLDRESIAAGTTKRPVEDPGLSGHGIELSEPVDMGENRLLFMNKTKPSQVFIYDPSREKQVLRSIQLALPSGKPCAPPVAAAGTLLVPLDTGRIGIMNWQTGVMITNPFQPSLKPNEKVQWTSIAVLPEDPEIIVVGDSRKKVYRVRVGERIRILKEASVKRDFLGPLTVLKKSVIAVGKTPAADMLLVLDSTNLSPKGEQLIEDGRVVWGPEPVGNLVVLATDDQKLRAFDENGKPLWNVDLPRGLPVGKPVSSQGMVVVSGTGGWLFGVDPASGKPIGVTEIGQPLAGSPLLMGEGYLAPGAEGIVFAVSPPSSN